MTDESLSDKIEELPMSWEGDGTWLHTRDVKEAVQKEDTILLMLINKTITVKRFWELRDKIFGDKLIDNPLKEVQLNEIRNQFNNKDGSDKGCNHPWQDARLDCPSCNPKKDGSDNICDNCGISERMHSYGTKKLCPTFTGKQFKPRKEDRE